MSDYMGFTYNKVHSSTLGIVRVSDGSRFNENLLPTIQDKTVPVPGGDGTYYFGSYYTQRQFNVSFAFDSLTEAQLAEIKRVFGDKGVHDLIFDEAPYKVYSAKVTGTATIKYIPFAEGATNRVYKGEGSVQFTCFYPFARYRFDKDKTKETLAATYPNINEWWVAAGVDWSKNFGDVPVPFQMIVSNTGSKKFENGTINWNLPEGKSATLDTKTGIAKSGQDIMNQYFTGDLILKIQPGEDVGNNIIFTPLYF